MMRPCPRGCRHRCSTANEELTSRRHPSRKSSFKAKKRSDANDGKLSRSLCVLCVLRDPKGVNSPIVLCLSPGTTTLAYYPSKVLKQCDFRLHCLKVIQR